MYDLQNYIMIPIGKTVTCILRKVRFRRAVASVLCAALLVNTVSIDASAAYDAVPSGEAQWVSEPGKAADETSRSLESVSGGNWETETERPHQNGGGNADNEDRVSGAASVSMSNLGVRPGIYGAAAAKETLQLDMSWPDNSFSNGILTLKKGEMAFSIFPGLSGSKVDAPILKIQIPSCMEVTSYPDASNEYLKPYLSSTDPVSMAKDSNGNTVLTYRFVPHMAWVNFAVGTKIASGYQIKSGETYRMGLDYYDGATLLASEEEVFTTKNPSMEPGGVTLSRAPSFSLTMQEGASTYDAGSYSWTVSAETGHYPYTSLKMIVPLPAGAVPGFGSGAYFNALSDNVPQNGLSSSGSFKLTYRSNYSYHSDDNRVSGSGGVLIYEIPAGNGFLSAGSSFAFHFSYPGLFLRFVNPKAGTYLSAASPRVECVIDGKTVVMQDYGTVSSYLTRVVFKELATWTTVMPYDEWSDIVFLQHGVSVYDTNAYVREIYASPEDHVAYDSLKMTVPLPAGAVPGFGTGASFTPLANGTAYENGSFYVTYYQNGSYSNASGSIKGTAGMLVYEIRSGGFLASGYSFFTFRGSRPLYLRFTNPRAGICKSAVSPKVEVTRQGKTTTMYDYNMAHYISTVTFVEPPDESGVYPDFVENESKGWSDTVTLEEGKSVYYTKMYDRKIYSPASLVPHYPYDRVRMTVLLPDEATPGFGTEDAFSPLEDGKTYTLPSRYGSWEVTYRKQYSYSNEDGSIRGTAQALAYVLDAARSTASFLKSSAEKTEFAFTGNSPSDSLYLRFTNPELKTYSSAASPLVECVMDGREYVSAGYFSQTEFDTSVTFEGPKTDWSRLSVSGSMNRTPYNLSAYYLLPEEYQSDKVYYGGIRNNTGYALKNVKISYTFDESLNVDRLELNLSGGGYPENAEIVYTTRMDGTERTASLNTSDNVFALEEGDAFVTAVITYDALESAPDYKNVLTASLHNYDKVHITTYRYVTSVPVSAESEMDNSEGYDGFAAVRLPFSLVNALYFLSAAASTTPTILDKGDAFTVKVSAANTQGKYQNLSLYLRMPKGYVLAGYVPPGECKNGEYRMTSRALEGGDILYHLEYTDNVLYDGGDHIFSFRVGPEADTSKSQTIPMPTAIYAAAGEGKLFQFTTRRNESQIGLDVNGDGDMDDSFYPITCTPVTINPLGILAIAGYHSAEGQIGEDQNNNYALNSKGNYRFIMYNCIGSGAAVSDGTLLVNLHKEGDIFTYDNQSYAAQFDVLLTGPVEPQGDFWESCTVQYSVDGTEWLTQERVEDYTKISQVKLQTAEGRELKSAESAYLAFPFAVNFPDNGGSGAAESYKTYIDVRLQYALDASDNPVTASVLNELTTMPLDFSGTIFQDRDWNGKRDEDETENDKPYTLKLYAGEGTGGTLLQETATDAVSGEYSFSVLLPGTYTLHVEKGEEEFYGASEYFDENGNYTFTLNKDISMPVTKGIDMGILTQNVLAKPQFSVVPALPDGKSGWYVNLPQVSLTPGSSSPYVDTMFWHDDEAAQKLTAETRPTVEATGVYAFRAYDRMLQGGGPAVTTSDIAVLDLKVDVDQPVIKEEFSCAPADRSLRSATGSFLPFGNFFNKAIQITIMAEDEGSGVDTLYYTLPGEQAQSVKPDGDGHFCFDVPMDTAGRITCFVEDKAGNTSDEVTLRRQEGSDLWMIEDRAPLWDDFVLRDSRGGAGIPGTDGTLWFAGAVNASARVTDEDSGLARILSRVNEEAVRTRDLTGDEKLTAFDFASVVDTEGPVLLWAEAEDNASNVSETQTAFGIDRTAPIIVLEEKTLSGDHPTATLLVKDAGSGIDPGDIHVLWQGREVESRIEPAEGGGYRLAFPIDGLKSAEEGSAYLVTAEDYVGWTSKLLVTGQQKRIIYVAAYTGSDETGDGSRTYPFRTLDTALERVAPGGMIVLLEDYSSTAYVNVEVTLDLNGKVLHGDVPGGILTVGTLGSLTIMDSNGAASAAEGFERDPETEGQVFGGIPGDPAFALEGGSLLLADGTIYCGYVGNGGVEVMEAARMMYLLKYLSGGGAGEAPGIHYIEENTRDALKQNTFTREGYSFQGWLYEDRLYTPGEEILMPGRNMETVAKWAKAEEEPETEEERGSLDPVPKTGSGRAEGDGASRTDRMELYIKIRKKEDEQNTEN